MTLSVTHTYNSTVTEGANSGTPGGLVGPNEWNAAHSWAGAASGGVLFFTNATTPATSSGFTWDNTNLALTIAGATITTSNPVVNLSQTWNAGAVTFTGIKLNVTDTASAAASLLLDLQKGGTSQFNIDKFGNINLTSSSWSLTPGGGLAFDFGATHGNAWNLQGISYLGSSAIKANSSVGSLELGSNISFGFDSGAVASTSLDTILIRDAAGIFAQVNSTNAQTLRIYNTSSSANANYERAVLDWTTTSNTLTIGAQAAGTGTLRSINLTSSGTIQLGAADAAAPVAQTLQVQSVVAGTSNTAGTDWTLQGSRGTGTGAGGNVLFKVAPAGSSGTTQNAAALVLAVEPNVIEQRNGATAQALRVYNTVDAYPTTTNYERGVFDWTTNTNILTIGTQAGGTGTARGLNFSATGFNTFWTHTSNAGIVAGHNWIWGLSDSTTPGTVAAVAIGLSATGVLEINQGERVSIGGVYGWLNYEGQQRVTSDFSVTSSTVLVNVTGLSVQVAAGRTYMFETELQVTDAAAGGVQAAIAGTCTATAIQYTGYTIADNAIKAKTNATALATAVGSTLTTETSGIIVRITGTITVNAAGTLTVQMAQNTSNGTATIAKRGSWFIVNDMP